MFQAPAAASCPLLSALGHTPARQAEPLPRSSRTGEGALVLYSRTGVWAPWGLYSLLPFHCSLLPLFLLFHQSPELSEILLLAPSWLTCFSVGSSCRLTSGQMCVASSSELHGPSWTGWQLPKGHYSVPRPDAAGWASCCLCVGLFVFVTKLGQPADGGEENIGRDFPTERIPFLQSSLNKWNYKEGKSGLDERPSSPD